MLKPRLRNHMVRNTQQKSFSISRLISKTVIENFLRFAKTLLRSVLASDSESSRTLCLVSKCKAVEKQLKQRKKINRQKTAAVSRRYEYT